MKFMYAFAELPENIDLIRQINSAAQRLDLRLKALQLNALNISDYYRKNLNYKKGNLRAELQKYAYILLWILSENILPLKQFVFTDYGARLWNLGSIQCFRHESIESCYQICAGKAAGV